MDNRSVSQMALLDTAALTPIVRQALGRETVEVVDWRWQELHGGAGAISGRRWLYRIAGRGHDQDEAVEWSLVLKIFHSLGDRVDPLSSKYWKQEVLAYQSGLLGDLPGGLVAPRCFGVAKQPNGDLWLWLEDIREENGPGWPLEHYGVVTRHLGQFNGAYLAWRPTPHPALAGQGVVAREHGPFLPGRRSSHRRGRVGRGLQSADGSLDASGRRRLRSGRGSILEH